MTTTFDAIRAIIVRDFDLPPERLQRDTLLEQIELDSLAITELVFSIEDEFKITAENTIPPFKTLGDITDYVARLVEERDAKARDAADTGEVPAKPSEGAAAVAASKRTGTKKRRAARNGAPPGQSKRSPKAANGTTEKRTKRSSGSRGARAR